MVKNYDIILFDLDGTITDSSPGITKGVSYALEEQGIIVDNLSDLYCFIGPPLMESFTTFYNMDLEATRKAIKDYREVYETKEMYDNNVYPGIEDLLKSLKEAGKKIIVTTSKPEKFAKLILEDKGLAQYFDFIGGADLKEENSKRGTKAEVIAYALDTCGLSDYDRSKMILIGDRKYDVLGAKEFDIDCLGVLFGFGNRQELEEAGAKYICANTEEIKQLLL